MPDDKPVALYYELMSFQEPNLALLEEQFDLIRIDSPEDETNELRQDVQIAFAPLKYHYDSTKIDKFPNLEVIASNRTGEPHIDRDYATSQGIAVYTLKGDVSFLETITPTAEHTWGLLLGVIRHIPEAHQSVVEGRWRQRNYPGIAMLSKMHMGVVGMGRLGKIVANQASAFGMDVSFYDPYTDENEVSATKLNSLRELVSTCHVISVHCRVTEETRKMFDEDVFSQFREDSYFVNTARGDIVDERALVDCLDNGPLAGAALDVFDGMSEINHEERLLESPIYDYIQENDDLLVTPHIAGCTYDAWEQTERRVIDKAIAHYDDWEIIGEE